MGRLVRFVFWLGGGKGGHRGKVFALVCVLLGLGAIGSVAAPYEPYEPIALRVVPDQICPNAEIEIETTRVWRDSWFHSIGTVEVSGQWRDTASGGLYPAVDGAPTTPDLQHPTGTVRADLKIPTPATPGTYTLLLQYDVSGRVLLAPRDQNIPPDPEDWLESVNTLTVLPATAEACND